MPAVSPHPAASRRSHAASVYRDPAGCLSPQQRWAVTMSWQADAATPAQAMCDAWEAVAGRRDWHTAEEAATVAGASPADASRLADAAVVSLSPNRRREGWIAAAEELAAEVAGPAGRRACEWLIDADVTVDAELGERIAVEAAAAALAAIDPRRRSGAAAALVRCVNNAQRPEPALMLRACRQAGAFVHRGRCYLLRPCPPNPVAAVVASDGRAVGRDVCVWIPTAERHAAST